MIDRKIMKNLFATGLVFLAGSCSSLVGHGRNFISQPDFSQPKRAYEFKGEIGGYNVAFSDTGFKNKMSIVQEDGSIVDIEDFNGDYKVDSVSISENGQIAIYTQNSTLGKPVLSSAQERYDFYVQSIVECKIDKDFGIKNKRL